MYMKIFKTFLGIVSSGSELLLHFGFSIAVKIEFSENIVVKGSAF